MLLVVPDTDDDVPPGSPLLAGVLARAIASRGSLDVRVLATAPYFTPLAERALTYAEPSELVQFLGHARDCVERRAVQPAHYASLIRMLGQAFSFLFDPSRIVIMRHPPKKRCGQLLIYARDKSGQGRGQLWRPNGAPWPGPPLLELKGRQSALVPILHFLMPASCRTPMSRQVYAPTEIHFYSDWDG